MNRDLYSKQDNIFLINKEMMPTTLNPISEKIGKIEEVMTKKESIWQTIEEMSSGTGIPESIILELVNSDAFVRSSHTRNGQNLYTTRAMFKKKASFGRKLLGYLKHRID
jgi:hypothetical protein